jgi:hypothetical protein
VRDLEDRVLLFLVAVASLVFGWITMAVLWNDPLGDSSEDPFRAALSPRPDVHTALTQTRGHGDTAHHRRYGNSAFGRRR